MSETSTDMIQHSVSRVAKAIMKPQKSRRVSSPTQALVMKQQEMVGNRDNKPWIEYSETCKTSKKKATEDIRKYNHEIIRETIMASKSLRKVQRTQMLGQDRPITLLDKQGRDIHEQDKIIERIEEFYTMNRWKQHYKIWRMGQQQATTILTSPHWKREKIPSWSHLLSCTLKINA